MFAPSELLLTLNFGYLTNDEKVWNWNQDKKTNDEKISEFLKRDRPSLITRSL